MVRIMFKRHSTKVSLNDPDKEIRGRPRERSYFPYSSRTLAIFNNLLKKICFISKDLSFDIKKNELFLKLVAKRAFEKNT